MKRIKIAYGGGRSLEVQVLQWLSSQEEFEVVAVCPVPYDDDPEYNGQLMSVINANNYTVCDVQGLLEYDIDIGLSVNYHRIIKEDILRHCHKGFYNIHHSYNLRLRGRNITTHAILNTLDENIFYHGTTLHMMVPELDAGGIIASCSISIEETDTAYSLFRKTDEMAFQMIKEWLPRIAFETVFPYEPPKGRVHSYRNFELPERRVEESMSLERVDAYIRAFDYPGKEPAFILKGDKRIHLVYNARDQYQKKFEALGKTYYKE